MCGIVTYFGGAGNHLTRVLTGISAINYRAPDSTGIGLFGDESEPVRTRKSIGAVGDLIKVLLIEPAYPDRAAVAAAAWIDETPSQRSIAGYQQTLLRLEKFSEQTIARAADPALKPPLFDDLVSTERVMIPRLLPGDVGRPTPLPVYRISSPEGLGSCVHQLIYTYDLSPYVVLKILREELKSVLSHSANSDPDSATAEELLRLFDQTMERMLTLENVSASVLPAAGGGLKEQEIWDALWKTLSECPIVIPSDYDRDGVRGVFRTLDGALLARLANRSDLKERLEEQLRVLWPEMKALAPLDWQHLFMMEKAANVFGRAASAALFFLQTESGLGGRLWRASGAGDADSRVVPGTTDPLSLRYWATPILAHGRWAIQSPVSVRNCHPFFDENRERAIALNGQFDSEIEVRIKTYLREVAGVRMRTQNSGEYFALLWGHHFGLLYQEQRRYEAVRRQTEMALTDIGVGSQAIDYTIFHQVRDLTIEDLDELAFRTAAKVMSRNGGQIAATGISLVSPRRVYVASHNRPVFIVRRPDNSDTMIVSDINAAIGLFPQKRVYPCTQQLLRTQNDLEAEIQSLVDQGASSHAIRNAKRRQMQREKEICADLAVELHPLEGESRFARIEATVRNDRVERDIMISDLDGIPDADFEPLLTALQPARVCNRLKATFFETHLAEVPARLEDILQAYTEDQSGLPDLPLNHKRLQRRFGRDFKQLHRLFIVGCGSSHHAALMARILFRRYLPQLTTIVANPSDMFPEDRFVNPEKDLVVMMSWSSTTAEMVELAASLARMDVVTVGISEKPFADMALVVAKSGGIIPSLSGEEVTVSAVKSTFCLMFCLAVLAAWLSGKFGRMKAALHIMNALATLPQQMRQLLEEAQLDAFCRHLVESKVDRSHCMVIHGADNVGIGMEAALKLEENGWVTPGTAMYFEDVEPGQMLSRLQNGLVFVNATSRTEFKDALRVMERLSEANLDFSALTYACREINWIQQWSDGSCIQIPKIEDGLQPFLDLVFYDLMAFNMGLARGSAQSGFPRNRAKSVTVGRSRHVRIPSPMAMLSKMALALAGRPEISLQPDRTAGPTLWENESRSDAERSYYRCMRGLVAEFDGVWSHPDGLLVGSMTLDTFTRLLFEEIPPDGHLVLAALDRSAEVAALNAAAQWNTLLPCGVRVERCGYIAGRIKQNSLLIVCGTRPPVAERVERILRSVPGTHFWAGPSSALACQNDFAASIGSIGTEEAPEAASDALYLTLCRLFSKAWQLRHPQRGRVLSQVMASLSETVDLLLNDGHLRSDIIRIIAKNRGYGTSFYVGPPGGTGMFWEDASARHGGMVAVGHTFGECVHGPLVTVDPRLDLKYIPMDSRAQMVADHGEDVVSEWERTYLEGRTVDEFLETPEIRSALVPSPIFGEGRWYLPELRHDYDVSNDNLIFLDATSRQHLSSALDELSAFSCRYARLVAIVGSSFGRHPDAVAVCGQPISHYLMIPDLDDQDRPIPDILMPLVRNILGTAVAAESAFGARPNAVSAAKG